MKNIRFKEREDKHFRLFGFCFLEATQAISFTLFPQASLFDVKQLQK